MINSNEFKSIARLFIDNLKLRFGKYYMSIQYFSELDNSGTLLKIIQNIDEFSLFGITIDNTRNICYNNKPIGFFYASKK